MSFTDNGDCTATISGTPSQAGTFSLTVTATNVDGSTRQTLSVNVLSSVQAPAFTSPGQTTFTVDTGASFQFTATGSPAPTFSVVSGPASYLPMNAAGLVSGFVDWGTGGIYHFVIEADNGVDPPPCRTSR